ncbi:MAG: hypothetical protein ACOCVJ_03890 [Verrucomicrobiota bacterium]
MFHAFRFSGSASQRTGRNAPGSLRAPVPARPPASAPRQSPPRSQRGRDPQDRSCDRFRHACATLLTLCLSASAQAAPEFFWQKDYAKVLPNGDLEWAPEPFAFEAAGEVRYIDYENGDDANDGASKAAPWKHHPSDANALGEAKSGSADTYVFKGGVSDRRICRPLGSS